MDSLSLFAECMVFGKGSIVADFHSLYVPGVRAGREKEMSVTEGEGCGGGGGGGGERGGEGGGGVGERRGEREGGAENRGQPKEENYVGFAH